MAPHCTGTCGLLFVFPIWQSQSEASAAGTEICAAKSDVERDRRVLVKGFATIDHVALINVEGTGMVGVHGTASAIFTTVRDAGVNVIMISQASSEHSVCFAVNQSEGDKAVKALGQRCASAILHSSLPLLLVLPIIPIIDISRFTGNVAPTPWDVNTVLLPLR